MSTKNSAPTRTRRFSVGFAVIAASAVAIAFPAVATAEAVWDIGEYDSCTNTLSGRPGSENDDIMAQEIENQKWCCYKSGGAWSDKQGCVAPAAEGAGSARPPSKVGLPTLNIRPPVEVLAPAPVVVLDRPEMRPVVG